MSKSKVKSSLIKLYDIQDKKDDTQNYIGYPDHDNNIRKFYDEYYLNDIKLKTSNTSITNESSNNLYDYKYETYDDHKRNLINKVIKMNCEDFVTIYRSEEFRSMIDHKDTIIIQKLLKKWKEVRAYRYGLRDDEVNEILELNNKDFLVKYDSKEFGEKLSYVTNEEVLKQIKDKLIEALEEKYEVTNEEIEVVRFTENFKYDVSIEEIKVDSFELVMEDETESIPNVLDESVGGNLIMNFESVEEVYDHNNNMDKINMKLMNRKDKIDIILNILFIIKMIEMIILAITAKNNIFDIIFNYYYLFELNFNSLTNNNSIYLYCVFNFKNLKTLKNHNVNNVINNLFYNLNLTDMRDEEKKGVSGKLFEKPVRKIFDPGGK